MTKHTLLSILLPALLASGLSAQTTLHLNGGATLANVNRDGEIEETRTGINAGVGITSVISGVLSFRVDGTFTQRGVKEDDVVEQGGEFSLEGNYLEVAPMLAVGRTGYLFFGPSFSFNLSCDVTFKTGGVTLSAPCEDGDVNPNTFDLGMMGGLGAVGVSASGWKVGTEILYTLGLLDMTDVAGEEKSRTLRFRLVLGKAL